MVTLPLAAAAQRLRKPPGRPRTRPPRSPAPTIDPALLGIPELARTLSVSEDIARDLIARGVLPRVRLPGPNGKDLRRVLVSRAAVDRLIVQWSDREVP